MFVKNGHNKQLSKNLVIECKNKKWVQENRKRNSLHFKQILCQKNKPLMLLMHCKIYWKIENESAYTRHTTSTG